MLDLINVAFGQAKNPQAGGNWQFLVLMVGTIAIFYFLMIRPQKKKEKERKALISQLKSGDKVLTLGGIYGIVDSVKENDILVIKIANNTKVEFARNAIQMKIS